MGKLKVFNPYTLELIRDLEFDGPEKIEKALATAQECLSGPDVLEKHERLSILEKLLQLIKENFSEIVQIAVGEGGKPYKDTVVEVDRAIMGVKLAISTLQELRGEIIPMGLTPGSSGRFAYTEFEPLGPVLAISAFNHPVNLIVHQVVTAIAIGAPVIIKPALKTPLSCLALVDLIHEAGLAPEWCQVIICSNQDTEKMVTDKRLKYISFIGSQRVGWHLRSILAPGTRIVLEHGGVAPVIIEEDAEIDSLIAPLVKGAFYHAGQVCVSVQRIYVLQKKMDEFLHKFIPVVESLKTGDPIDPKTDVGPLILPIELERINRWVRDAQAEGGKILTGGNTLSEVCYQPTAIYNPATYSYVTSEEIFGPVVSIYPVKNSTEAIDKANSLPFAFQSAVFTAKLDLALDYTRKLKANTVLINDSSAFRVDWMPFGGSELSGLGTGGIKYAMKDMCREKLVMINRSSL